MNIQNTKKKTQVAIMNAVHDLPVLVARDKGYFKDEGLDLEFVTTPGMAQVTTSHLVKFDSIFDRPLDSVYNEGGVDQYRMCEWGIMKRAVEANAEGLRGRKIVLYFYPKDDTPGCTKEACSFRDEYAAFRTAGVALLGISPDDEASHQKFAAKFELPFQLLADPEATIAQAYEVWKEKNMYGKQVKGIERTTFVIDGDGKVARFFPKVKPEGHAEEVLAALKQKTAPK